MRRKLGKYFKVRQDDPSPLLAKVEKRVSFSDVDIMGILWYGRYTKYFEEGFAAIGRMYGLSYKDFYESKIHAPIVQVHIDYHLPIVLNEICMIEAYLIWDEGARLNIEYSIIKENGKIAATGYTVQMFIDAETREPYILLPDIIKKCHRKWVNGGFKC